MPVDSHSQGPAIFVSKPSADGGDVDAGFDAGRGEEVAEIVVREMREGSAPAYAPLRRGRPSDRRFSPRFPQSTNWLLHGKDRPTRHAG